MTQIEQYKNRISEKYIEDFKKDLSFFEKIMLMPISKKMDEILKSNKKITVDSLGDLEDLGFWRKVLGVRFGNKRLFEKLSSKVFNFLKEKQEKIIQAESSGRLEELQSLVIEGKLDDLEKNIEENTTDNSTKSDSNLDKNDEAMIEEDDKNIDVEDKKSSSINPKLAGVGTGVLGGAAFNASMKNLEKMAGISKVKEVPKGFEVARTKKLMTDIYGQLKGRVKSPKINTAMKKSYEKSIKVFEEAAGSLDANTGKAFQERQRWSNNIPEKALKSLNADRGLIKLLDDLPEKEANKFLKKSAKDIKKFLDGKKIRATDEVIDMLKLAKNADELKSINLVFKNSTKLAKLSKGLKGIGAISVIFLGVDVWVYFETMKEVDAIKKINEVRGEMMHDRARAQLGVGISVLLLEAAVVIGAWAAGGSLAGPVGLAVGLIIGAVYYFASELIDELYYDKKDFYSQNRYDYINQERTVIKQSIIQLLESDRRGMHEKMKESIKAESIKKGKKLNTMAEAREALIFQEETLSGHYSELQQYYYSGQSEKDYENTLKKSNPEQYKVYLEEKENMENIIKVRMEYIKNYIEKDSNTPEYKSMKEMLSKYQGIEYVENVLADSKVYHYIKGEHDDAYIENYKDLSVEEYKKSYGKKLKADYPDKFDVFEKLSIDNPVHFYEICWGAKLSKSSILSGIENNDSNDYYNPSEKEQIEANLDFIEKYFEYWGLGRSMEKEIGVGMSKSDNVLDYSYIEKVLINLEHLSERPLWDSESAIDYFSNIEVFQARLDANYQVSSDTGQNILYSMAKEFHGYLGDNKQLDILNFYNEGVASNTSIYYKGGWKTNIDRAIDGSFSLRDIDDKNMTAHQVCEIFDRAELTSAAKVADQEIRKEYDSRIKKIIEREIGYRDQKENYEKKLINFIKTQSSNREGYLEIPYDLVIECKKAKIGDVENYLFKFEKGVIVAMSTGAFVGTGLNFDKTKEKVKYEAITPLREELTAEEKNIIDKVKMAHTRLEDIRILESSWAKFINSHKDDLGIPIELEKEMSNKRHEREKIERSLLYMSPISAKSYLSSTWEEYYSYFEDSYIGILARVSQFKTSDNLSNINYMNQAWSWINRPIVEIENNQVIISEDLNLEKDEKFYLLKYIKETKDEITGKTAEQLLLANEDDNENELTVEHLNEKGKRMARQILIAVLEQETVGFDKNGRAKNIGCNIDLVDETESSLKKIEDGTFQYNLNSNVKKSWAIMEDRIKMHLGYSSNIEVQNSLMDLEVDDIQTKTPEIKEVSEGEQASHESINELTQKILKTKDEVDRAGKRGTPNFVPDYDNIKDNLVPGVFESWGHSVGVSVTETDSRYLKGMKFQNFKIDGLDVKFNLEEGLRMANFINWVKYQIPRNPDYRGKFYYGTVGGYLKVDNSLLDDTVILYKSTAKESYPDMLNGNKDKVLAYLNSL
ncbi:MAG: hypothetical protein M0P94_01815 [Candidatus Absconditabacterales bacterium]|nr:hypothetical protein [Candidatus Absconditabacterales bacterium]